jgi:hypothetical protein
MTTVMQLALVLLVVLLLSTLLSRGSPARAQVA